MRLRELLRFRRDSGGCVPSEILRQISLPMPDDVFEQFVVDHGTNESFQQQYGHIDLHAVRWTVSELPASELLACSIFDGFRDMVETVSKMACRIPEAGWRHVNLPPGAAEHWQSHGTWMRAPLFLRGELVGSSSELHLVEGHTRNGMLRGLVRSKIISESDVHRLWIGEQDSTPIDDGPWREVLSREHMSFVDWLMDQIDDVGELGKIAERLIDLKHSIRHRGGFSGTDVRAVLDYTDHDQILKPFKRRIEAAYEDWKRVMNL